MDYNNKKEKFILKKIAEQEHLFPAVSGFHWERFFEKALEEAWEGGKSENK